VGNIPLCEEVQYAVWCWVGTGQDVWEVVVDAGRESCEYTIQGQGRGRQMKGRKRKDSTSVIRAIGEDGGNGGNDRLENENIREYSTCRVRIAEKGILAGSNSEDCKTRLHQARCKETSENDEIW
jgi:hypothetical protein